MKKLYYLVSFVFLLAIMFVNLNLTLSSSSGKLALFNLEALGQIYDLGELPEVTIRCAGSDDLCFLPNGCRCYKSQFGWCPKCYDRNVYFCGPSGFVDDICGKFEIYMQGLPWDHNGGCPYK